MELNLDSLIIPRLLYPLTDSSKTMRLSPEEVERALAIKEALNTSTTNTTTSSTITVVKDVTDFEFVQWALAHPGSSMETILQHIGRMQLFKHEYHIEDTLEEAVACLDAVAQQQPGHLLSLLYLQNSGNCFAVSDWSAFFPGKCTMSSQHQAIFLKGSYYKFQCLFPTFRAIREGLSEIVECHGMTWDNHDADFFDQMFEQLIVPYPKHYKEVYYANSSTVANVAFGLWKRHMNQNMRNTFRLGSQLQLWEGRRMNELFGLPTPDLAQADMLRDARDLLQARYTNQANYSLPPRTQAASGDGMHSSVPN